MNLIPQFVRDGVPRLLGPIAQLLVRLHIRPNTITTLGTLILVASAVAFAAGRMHAGGFLLLISGLFDMLDGRVARDGGARTTFGAFYDSTLDRVGESAIFTGIAIYFLNSSLPRERVTAAVILCCIALSSSLLVSYTRARAEGLGIECNVGIVQRAERVLLLGVPTFFFGGGPNGALVFWIVAVLAVASSLTVVQRVVHVARTTGRAGGDEGPGRARPSRPRDTIPGHAAALQSRKGP